MENIIGSKNEYEVKKLDLEIKELQKPWWKKHTYLGILLTTLIAGATAFGAFRSGVFDVKYERLQLEKVKLELDARFLSNKYKRIADSLSVIARSLENKKLAMINEYKRDEKKHLTLLKSKDEIINYYKTKCDSLTNLIIKIKSIKKTLGEFDNSFSNDFLLDNSGNILLNEDGHPLSVN